MRVEDIARSLAGGVVVYVVMAACSGSQDAPGRADVAGGSGGMQMSAVDAAGSGGAVAEREAGILESLVDALAEPVAEAKAALPPDIATEQCNKTASYNGGAGYYMYAEHLYPGKTINDLANIRVVTHLTPASPFPGYEYQTGGAYLANGRAAVPCGTNGSTSSDSIVFILPAI
jgi:hypothetical protein